MAWALSGIMAGAVGWLLFLAAHAFLITSIWDRAFTGLPFAALAGLTLACAMRSFEIRSLKGSIGFGVLVWALLLPPTAVASWLRVTGIRHEWGIGTSRWISRSRSSLDTSPVAHGGEKPRLRSYSPHRQHCSCLPWRGQYLSVTAVARRCYSSRSCPCIFSVA